MNLKLECLRAKNAVTAGENTDWFSNLFRHVALGSIRLHLLHH